MQEKGLITIYDPGADRPLEEIACASCVHCGGQFPIRPGSGRIRGFCMNCNGPVCGPSCEACQPLEVYLDNIEKGRPADYRPIVVPASL